MVSRINIGPENGPYVAINEDNGNIQLEDNSGNVVAEWDETNAQWDFANNTLANVDALDSNSVSTDELLGAWPSDIRVTAGGELTVIDPADSTTPVQDAFDAVSAAGGGTVIMPDSTVEDTGPLNPPDDCTWRGHFRKSEVKITGEGNDGVVFDDVTHFTWDGVQLTGLGANSNTGDAVVFENNPTGTCSFPRVRIQEWQGRAIRGDVSLFEADFGVVRIQNVDAGNEDGVVQFSAGIGITFSELAIYPDDSGSGSASIATNFDGTGDITIDFLNVGGTCSRAVNHGSGNVSIEMINYEPTGLSTTPEAVVWSSGTAPLTIGSLTNRADVSTGVDYAYRLSNGGNTNLGPTRGDAFETNVVKIHNEQSSASWYWGELSDIDDTTDADTLVRAMATAGAASN